MRTPRSRSCVREEGLVSSPRLLLSKQIDGGEGWALRDPLYLGSDLVPVTFRRNLLEGDAKTPAGPGHAWDAGSYQNRATNRPEIKDAEPSQNPNPALINSITLLG